MATTKIPIRSVMKDLTINVEVTGVRSHQIRQWVALRLIRAAAWLLGCNIQVHFPAKTATEDR